MRKDIRFVNQPNIPQDGFGDAPLSNISISEREVEEAIVLDVVVNEDHPLYNKDGYNVGAIKFRFLRSNMLMPEQQLAFAFPMDTNIVQYPLINEIVNVIIMLGRYYYTHAINITNRVTASPVYGLNRELTLVPTSKKVTNYQNVSSGVSQTTDAQSANILGKYYKDNLALYRLKSFEGDIIYEGRFGNSIRFGSNGLKDQSPTLILRAGQNPNATPKAKTSFGTIIEDINGDLSSIWMVTNQTVSLKFASDIKNNKVHFRSIRNAPSQLNGNQIFINTDRLIFNSKKDKIIGSAFNGIHWETLQDFTVDAEANIILHSTKDINIISDAKININSNDDSIQHSKGNITIVSDKVTNITGNKVIVGKVGGEEPMVLGTELINWLQELCSALESETHPTPSGPSGPPTNSAQYGQLASKLRNLLSQHNYVTKNN